jgi:prefoldin alpha subunit
MEDNQQELMFKLSMFEQQVQYLQKQIQAVERGVIELSSLSLELEDLKGKKNSEIFANVGRGIFVKAKILDEDLLVDVGNKNFVKKNISETRETIEEQVKKLQTVKDELEENLEKMGEEMNKVLMNAQKESEECHDENCEEHSHGHKK